MHQLGPKLFGRSIYNNLQPVSVKYPRANILVVSCEYLYMLKQIIDAN